MKNAIQFNMSKPKEIKPTTGKDINIRESFGPKQITPPPKPTTKTNDEKPKK